MGLTGWLRSRRIKALERQLACVEAAIAAEEQVMQLTGRCYPSVIMLNATEKARITSTLNQLRGQQTTDRLTVVAPNR